MTNIRFYQVVEIQVYVCHNKNIDILYMVKDTFTADYSNSEIILQKNESVKIITIPISSLLLNNGNHPTKDIKGENKFEQHQQQINYLDSVKDGANVSMLQGLNIYPRASENNGYPSFDNLHP